jgi:diguanylate cyclase (GGDEF)-like protein
MAHAALLQHEPSMTGAEVSAVLNTIASGLRQRFTGDALDGESASLLARLLTLAAEAEQTIAEQKRRIAELEELSTTDELTGLPNRRAFVEAIRRSLADAGRHGDTGVVAFVDLDGLKGINDAHGHAAGNAAIEAVARALQAAVRASDVVARLHGDEFAVLLARSDARRIDRLVARLRAQVENVVFRHGGRRFKVSASVGATCYRGGLTVDEILDRADRAMYEAKQTRREARAARPLRPAGGSAIRRG